MRLFLIKLFLAQLAEVPNLSSARAVLPAVLTILPRLHVDLTGALSSADVLCCSLVLQGSSEECSAAEAGDGSIVNMPSCSLPAYLGKCQI